MKRQFSQQQLTYMEADQAEERQIANGLAQFLCEAQHYVELRYFLLVRNLVLGCVYAIVHCDALYRSSHAHV
jgi:hypothetical protein